MSAEEALGVATGDEGVDHRTPQQAAASKQLQATQAKVDEVVDIMQTNMSNLLKRDENLSTLQHKSEGLEESSSLFQRQANKLKTKFQWANMKMMIIIGVILLIIFIIIIINVMPERHEPHHQIDHSSTTRATNTVTVTHQTQKTFHTTPHEPKTTPSTTEITTKSPNFLYEAYKTLKNSIKIV